MPSEQQPATAAPAEKGHERSPSVAASVRDTGSTTEVDEEAQVAVTEEKKGVEAGVDAASASDHGHEYPTGTRLLFIIIALVLSIFLVALDMTIVATAIPKITDQFQRLDQVSWYGSAFFMTVAAFQSTCKSRVPTLSLASCC